MQRVLVTGGAGFIGCNLVRRLLAAGDRQVVVFDALTYAGSLASLRDVEDHPGFRFVRGDVTDREAVRAAFRELEPTAVANLAAESHVDRSIDSPGVFVHTNVVGTFELLEAARGYLAELPAGERRAFRFLHVSTDEVYGSLGPDPEELFTEATPYAPRSPYAASKAGADHLVAAYHETYGLPAIVTNCSNNYGPYQFPEKLIPLMILNAVEGRELPIYGDGRNVRDWIYVDDHCAGLEAALERGLPGGKYNLGGRNERTNLEVVDRLCDVLAEELPAGDNPALRAAGATRYHDLKKFVSDRPGHDRRYAIDPRHSEAELGWRAAHDFESGLREAVRWYLAHRDWCAEVSAGVYDRGRLGLGAGR